MTVEVIGDIFPFHCFLRNAPRIFYQEDALLYHRIEERYTMKIHTEDE